MTLFNESVPIPQLKLAQIKHSKLYAIGVMKMCTK